MRLNARVDRLEIRLNPNSTDEISLIHIHFVSPGEQNDPPGELQRIQFGGDEWARIHSETEAQFKERVFSEMRGQPSTGLRVCLGYSEARTVAAGGLVENSPLDATK